MFARSLRVVAASAALLTLVAFAPTHAQENAACVVDVEKSLAWMLTLQNDDGGFTSGFQPESEIGSTADAILAFASTGYDLATIKKTDKTALDYLQAQVESGATDTAGEFGKTLLAIKAANGDPTAFGGVDLTAKANELLAKADTSDLFGLSLAILGVAKANVEVPAAAIDTLVSAEAETGGWGYAQGQTPDTNTTALAIQALIAAGQADKTEKSLDYLKSIQNEDKGWPYQVPSDYGTDSDANSTAAVIQAILASGQSLESWGNPQNFLATFQAEDGSFTFQLTQPAPNFLATAASIPALCGSTLNPDVAPTMAATEAK